MTSANVKEIIVNPSKQFSHPSQVVSTPDLSRKQKVEALNQWELDARLLQVATEEGMSGGEQNMLADVKKAQEDLGVAKDEAGKGGVPNKNGM